MLGVARTGGAGATEAAIVNALLAAETMVGRDGVTAHGLSASLQRDAIERVKRG